jgi:hypothetical protein
MTVKKGSRVAEDPVVAEDVTRTRAPWLHALGPNRGSRNPLPAICVPKRIGTR